jgi:hypothetical protein
MGALDPKGKTRRWRIVAPLGVAGALVVAGVAGAANSGAFADRGGDAKLTPDITSVNVSNDDAGTITIQTAYGAGAVTPGLPGEKLGVALDLDQNPDTGTVYYGTEVALLLDFGPSNTKLTFARAAGTNFDPAPPPPSLAGTIDGATGVVRFTVKAADLGLAPTSGFNLVSFSSSIAGEPDFAPDLRTYNFQQVAGTPAPAPPPDARAPVDGAFVSHGIHGKVAHLEYAAQDGRGETADTIRVYRGARLLRTRRVGLSDANPFFSYDARWRVPRTVRGRLRFCVRSVDAAGNKSNLSCAPLVIR